MAKIGKFIPKNILKNIDKGLGDNQANDWTGSKGIDIFFAKNGADICDGGNGKDIVDGGGGDDTILGGAGQDELYGGAGDDDISAGAGNDYVDGGSGNDTINGDSGNDQLYGGEGDDTIDGGSGRDLIQGDLGNDNISGGSGNDQLDGGEGNDFVSGNTGDDLMLGQAGDDVLDWDDGDGNDIMSGGEGRDTIEVDGSVTQGDNFVLGKNLDGKAFFERVGLDGQPVGQFNLTVDTAEVFDVSGDVGNDTFIINDLFATGVEEVQFDGGAGNDLADGRNTATRLVLNGGEGDDILIGGTGTIVGLTNAKQGDTLTGGIGKDKFEFRVDPFAAGVPDVITDYEQGGIDQFVFDKLKFGINEVRFQRGAVNQLQDGNVLVLEGKFDNAGQAAQAIADNAAITTGKGLFVYFNQTLGFSRVVASQDLAGKGAFSVQANLTNLTSDAAQTQFSQADFALA